MENQKSSLTAVQEKIAEKVKESEEELKIALRQEAQARSDAIATVKTDAKKREEELEKRIGAQVQSQANSQAKTNKQVDSRVSDLAVAQATTQADVKASQEKTQKAIDQLTQQQEQLEKGVQETEVINDKKLGEISAGIGALAVGVATIEKQTSLPNLISAAADGTCQSMKNPGCTQGMAGQVAQGVGNNMKGMLLAGIPGLYAGQAAILTQIGVIGTNVINILAVVNNTWTMLGEKFTKLWSYLAHSRVWGIVNFILNLHNATMLSRQLGVTLIETVNTVLQAIGIKDPEGQTIDIGEVLGSNVNSFFESLVGAENWAGTKATWARANRIIQTAAQLKDNVLAFANAIGESQEIIGGWIAQGFNGLKEEGIVSDDRYDWIPENPQFKNHFGRVETFIRTLTDATESVNQLAQSVIETQELAIQIDDNFDTLKTEMITGQSEKTTEEITKDTDSSTTATITNYDLKEAPPNVS